MELLTGILLLFASGIIVLLGFSEKAKALIHTTSSIIVVAVPILLSMVTGLSVAFLIAVSAFGSQSSGTLQTIIVTAPCAQPNSWHSSRI